MNKRTKELVGSIRPLSQCCGLNSVPSRWPCWKQTSCCDPSVPPRSCTSPRLRGEDGNSLGGASSTDPSSFLGLFPHLKNKKEQVKHALLSFFPLVDAGEKTHLV